MKKVCCVCKKEREVFQTLTLTDTEKWLVEVGTDQKAPDTTDYCKACWNVCIDRVQGPQLMRGLMTLRKPKGKGGN